MEVQILGVCVGGRVSRYQYWLCLLVIQMEGVSRHLNIMSLEFREVLARDKNLGIVSV